MDFDLRYSTSLSLARALVGFTFWVGCIGLGGAILASSWAAIANDSSINYWLYTPPVDVWSIPVPEDPDFPRYVQSRVSAEPFMFPIESNGRVTEIDVESVTATVRVQPTGGFAIFVLLQVVGLGGVWLWGLFLLRRLLRDVDEGSVFSMPNAYRIRWLGLLMIAAAFVDPAFGLMLAGVLDGAIEMRGAGFEASLPDLELIVVGLLTLVLSEVWRHGVQLQVERDLTV